MIDIKILEQHRGMVIAYACKSFDARIAPRLHQFWQTEMLEDICANLDWMVVDVEQVLVMDASGLAVIVHHYQQLPAGVPLSLVGCNVAVTQLLHDTYVSHVFPQYASLNDVPAVGSVLKFNLNTAYRSHRLHLPW